jgi:hypothetical protein
MWSSPIAIVQEPQGGPTLNATSQRRHAIPQLFIWEVVVGSVEDVNMEG